MSKSYGEVQASIRDTIIFANEGYLGPNSPLQGVADTQVLIFKSSDLGPWFLTPNRRKIQRHDWPMGKVKIVERSKKVLLEALKEMGVTLQLQQGYTKNFKTSQGITSSSFWIIGNKLLLDRRDSPKAYFQFWESGG
jgi:hypothetical protein